MQISVIDLSSGKELPDFASHCNKAALNTHLEVLHNKLKESGEKGLICPLCDIEIRIEEEWIIEHNDGSSFATLV